jgi:hypothetical protein
MSDYVRPDGLVARIDTTTPCRCGKPDCAWTEADDSKRDRIEYADRMGPILYPEMYPERAR